MVHVRVGEQDQVDSGKLGKLERRRCQTFQPQRNGAEIQPGTVAEDRIGEDGCAVHLEQYRAVAEPRGVQAAIGPRLGIWMLGWVNDGTAEFAGVLLPKGGRGTIRENAQAGQPSRTTNK